jgi:hypothetical protein
VLSQTSERLISRFFLNLRSIYYYDESTAVSRTTVFVLSPIRTHAFWKRKRPRRSTTGFSFGHGAETGVYGGLTTHGGVSRYGHWNGVEDLAGWRKR